MTAHVKSTLVLVLLTVAASQGRSATLALDSAADSAYASSWTTGANGGSGFGAWTLASGGGLGGFFTGSSVNNASGTSPGIDTGGRSWGLWANSGGSAVAFRSFVNPLATGQVFQLDMDNGYVEAGSSVGFAIRTGNATGGTEDYNTGARFQFLYIGYDASNSYKVVDSGGFRNVGIPFTGTGLRLTFLLNTPTSYTLRIVDNATGATNTVTGVLQDSAPLQSIALYSRNAGPDSPHDAFFNSPSVTGEAATSVKQSSLDAGGQRIVGSGVAIDGCIGGIGDVATASEITLKGGYIGQLPDVSSVAVSAAPSAVDEGDPAHLAGAAGMDDGSVTALAGDEIAWSSPAFPVLSVSAAGLAETMMVYADTFASVTGRYQGVTGSGVFLVRDANPDNFGIYAADGVPDSWQVQRFGIHNFDGAAHANPDGDPYDNLQEWIALTDPTDPASYFRIVAISNRAPASAVCVLSSSNRLYRLLWSTNLAAGSWSNPSGEQPVAGNGGLFWLVDTNAASPRFYKVAVGVP